MTKREVHGGEYKLAEWPCIEYLQGLGYTYLEPAGNEAARDRLNEVLLKAQVIDAIVRINGVSEDTARAVYGDLMALDDNEKWQGVLRGNLSRLVPGQSTQKTIRLIDFLNLSNNTFVVTNQFHVDSHSPRRPDVVLFVNGIPLVVIEAKSPLASRDKNGEAFDQIKQYERDIPRLFLSNVFNIVTSGHDVLYGATGSPSKFWGTWVDPWPKRAGDFRGLFEKGLWSLLEPGRLLDLLAHFVVFEHSERKVIKKICRYQQFRAVNKMVSRVVDGKERKGLVWHTQGSGKSLTMAFAALKLKYHHNIDSEALANPNVLVLTDRRDLDDQISKTFAACKLPVPIAVRSEKGAGSATKKLLGHLHSQKNGLTVLSTIFLLEGSQKPVTNSENWIVLVDECHRTQEKDLGAYLRATLPNARYFGFTGTPVKNSDLDTYRNFGAPGEGYLDKYGIDDAVRDGATVPIRHIVRLTKWQVDSAKLDVLFDRWFEGQPQETIDAIKARGVALADLLKHPSRVDLIAYDMWTHYCAHVRPDGFKGQVVVVDREAVVLYKRAFNKHIAAELVKEGLSKEEAEALADKATLAIYSSGQEDDKPSEDPRKADIRKDLMKYALDADEVRKYTGSEGPFQKKHEPPYLIIVCNKLLTGFDAPIESVMYLDNPLKEHNLLQAIARTNRVEGDKKKYGLINDYIGVTKKLDEALASYRADDVAHATEDLNKEFEELKKAHAAVLEYLNKVERKKDNSQTLRTEIDALFELLKTEDEWLRFRMRGQAFVGAYEALSPDPEILKYRADLKWVVAALKLGALRFDKEDKVNIKEFSAKIRDMLAEHLQVTGITTVCQLRTITDPDFWQDFTRPEEETPADLKTAAARKAAEMRTIVAERMKENRVQYGPFSTLVEEAIRKYDEGVMEAAQMLAECERIALGLQAEEQSLHKSGLSPHAFGAARILEQALVQKVDTTEQKRAGDSQGNSSSDMAEWLKNLAKDVERVYAAAPQGWVRKEELRKEMRQQIRVLMSQTTKYSTAGLREAPKDVDEFFAKQMH